MVERSRAELAGFPDSLRVNNTADLKAKAYREAVALGFVLIADGHADRRERHYETYIHVVSRKKLFTSASY